MKKHVVFCLLAIFCSAITASGNPPMQTQCFGRFELNIPKGFVVSQFKVSRNGVSLSLAAARSFEQMKAVWHSEAAAWRSKPNAKAGHALLEAQELDRDTLLLSWYDSHASTRLIRVRLYHFTDGQAYVLEKAGPSDNQVAIKAQLQSMATQIRSRPDDQAGLCFDGGFLLAPEDSSPENVQVNILFPAKSDVRLTLDTNTNNGEVPEPISARLAGAGIELEPAFARVRKLFSEPRVVNGIKGEAVGYKVPTEPPTLAHRLAFHALGTAQPDVLQPEITVQLKTGEQQDDATYPQPSLSDEEVQSLFDSTIGTLRPRSKG